MNPWKLRASAISISRLRPHCFEASTTARKPQGLSVAFCFAEIAPLGHQRNQAADPQFNGLLDQPSLAVPLGQRDCQGQLDAQLTVDRPTVEDQQVDLGAANALDARRELRPTAVEQYNFDSRPRTHYVGQMVGLGPQHLGLLAVDRPFDKVAVGHKRRMAVKE